MLRVQSLYLNINSINLISGYLGFLSSSIHRKIAQITDTRIRLIDEIIGGNKVIRMYAWENYFIQKLKAIRKSELRMIRNSAFIRGIYMTLSLFVNRMMIFSVMLTIVVVGFDLTSAHIFMIYAYFNIVGHALGQMFVRGVSELAEVSVSIRRLEEFLMLDECAPNSLNVDCSNKAVIKLANATAFWKRKEYVVCSETMSLYSQCRPTLAGINVACFRRSLIGILGPVGSGKTSLLEVILQELPLHSGRVCVQGSLSYACQEPWTFNGTIKQNIILKENLNEKHYSQVIEACALKDDFADFQFGDNTVIGERGASLSGGQKARVNLARAVYRKADIYLFDDPLSAVDSQVGRYIFDDVISNRGLLQQSTRLLVTHQIDYLKDVDWIIVLNQVRLYRLAYSDIY